MVTWRSRRAWPEGSGSTACPLRVPGRPRELARPGRACEAGEERVARRYGTSGVAVGPSTSERIVSASKQRTPGGDPGLEGSLVSAATEGSNTEVSSVEILLTADQA